MEGHYLSGLEVSFFQSCISLMLPSSWLEEKSMQGDNFQGSSIFPNALACESLLF